MAETVVKVYYGNLMMLPDVSRVLACLNEKNVKFEIINMTKGQHPVPVDFLKLQEKPSNRVQGPLIEEGTKLLTGSRTICRYFSEKYEKQGYEYLLGSDPLERASIEQWLRSEEHSFDPLSWTLAFHIAFAPLMNLEPERGLVQESERKLSEVLDVYNQRLAESKFLAGNKFTLADLVHLPNSHYLANSKEWDHLFTSRKHVKKWWKKISERESWRKTVMKLDGMPSVIGEASTKGIVPRKSEVLSAKLVELPDDTYSSEQNPPYIPQPEADNHPEPTPRSDTRNREVPQASKFPSDQHFSRQEEPQSKQKKVETSVGMTPPSETISPQQPETFQSPRKQKEKTESEIPSQAAHVPPRTETLQPSKPPEMSQFSKPIHPQLSVLEGYYLAQTHPAKLHTTKDPQQDQEPRNATPPQKPAQGNIKHEVDRPGYPTPQQQVHQFQQMPSESQIHKLENPISSMQHKENISSTTPVELASTDPRFPPPMVRDSFAQPSQQPIDLNLQESESNRNKIQSDGTYYKEKSSQAHFENFTGATRKSEAHDSQLESPSHDLQPSQKNNGETIPESYPQNGASSKPPRVLPRPLESKGQPLAIQPPEPQADAPYRNLDDTEFSPYVNKKKKDFRSEDSLPTYSNLLESEDFKIPKAVSHSSHQKPPDPVPSQYTNQKRVTIRIPEPTLPKSTPPSLLPKRLESEAQVTHQSKDIQAKKGKPNLFEPNSDDTEFVQYIKKKNEDFRSENSVQTPNLPQSSDPMIFGPIEKQVPRTQFEARDELSQEISTPHSTLSPTTKKKSPPKEKINHLDVKPEPFKPEKREGQPTSAMIPSPTLQDEANQPFESPIESIEKLSDNKEAPPIAPSILGLNTQQKLSQSYKDQPDAQDNKISPEPLQVSRKKNENEKTPPIHLYAPQDENNQAPRTGSSLEKSKLSSSEQTSPKGTSTSSTKKQMTQPSYTPEIPTQPFPQDPFGQSPNQQSQAEVLFKGEAPKPFEQAPNSPLERKPSSGESPFQQGQTKVPLKGTPSKPFEQESIPSKETLTSSDMEQTPRSASQLETPIQTPPSPKKPVGQSAGQQAQAEMPLKEEASEPFEQAFISPNQRSEEVRNPAEKSRGKNDTSLLQSDLIPKARQEIATYSRKTGDPTNIRQVSAEKPQMPEGNGEDGSAPKSPKPQQESITRKEGEQLHEPFPSFTHKNEANQPSKPQTETNYSYPEQDSTMGKLHTPSMAQGPVPTSQPELLERTKPSSQKPVGHSLSEQAQAEVPLKQEMVKPFEQAQEPETQKEVQKPERKFAVKSDISDSQPNLISNTKQETSPSSRKSTGQADIKQMPPKKQEPDEMKDADTVD